MKFIFAVFLSIFFAKGVVFSQISYPQGYFKNPLEIPIKLAATFGELRTNHFHSGLDIKTNSVPGLRVLASASGYVSRISISGNGYGNALYITHPNGYTTVYGHLEHFNNLIDSMAKSRQYSLESFNIEYYPKPNEIQVEAGQLVAYSGNTGGSSGPHLHFEIRDSQERSINPFLFGFAVSDNLKPTIDALRIYNLCDTDGNLNINTFNLNKITLSERDTIKVTEKFYLGISSFDKQDGQKNRNGIYSYSIKLDGIECFRFDANKIDFSEKRYINAYIDFEENYKTKNLYQLSKVLPRNKLSMYGNVKNSGVFEIKDNLSHSLEISSKDFKGNEKKIITNVRKAEILPNKKITPTKNMHFSDVNKYKIASASINIPANILYEDVYFTMNEFDNNLTKYSKIIEVGNPYIPLHSYISLKIKAEPSLTPDLYKYAAIGSIVRGEIIFYQGGAYEDGFVSTRIRTFGKFLIIIDTIAPYIKAINVIDGKNISKQKDISFTIGDNLSGVKSYRGSIDGKWVLGKYDAKTRRLVFSIDEHFPKGNFVFSLLVKDDKGNSKELKLSLTKN